ncbi:MAG: methylmalonyl Co-A mutase-associated GTPase MeaB, partial [Mucispirillum sp.]|nr:methylmalonyl Co-A mutase-associated GTPase MeaB [Mucispirillum sp.]
MNEFCERVFSGDIRAAARLMRLVDDRSGGYEEYMKEVWKRAGKAHIIGITGAPGAGKSTITDKLISKYRNMGKTVGVVAIDPTSPFSGGAILGDRIRMANHAVDEGVFIRSVGTRGHLGGLSVSTMDIVAVMDAMGKDIIIIETVGVGQDEVEIAMVADTCIVVTVPGLGDDIQAIKAGIFEIADIFVVNKADREGVERTVRDLKMMLEMVHQRTAWNVDVLKT